MFCFLASIKGWVGRVLAITPNIGDKRSRVAIWEISAGNFLLSLVNCPRT